VFDEFLARASADENVVGVVLYGSRGKGELVGDESDWDVYVVVREHRGDWTFTRGDPIEGGEVTLDELRAPPPWMRYALAWVEPPLDKTGEVAAALREAVRVDPASARESLDAYVNSLYRSLKDARAGLDLASLLDAQESLASFLDFVFTVHGRVRPYNKWLAWELERHPLPIPTTTLLRVERIARTGDLEEQHALFREAEALAREHGLDAVIDGWEPDVAWLRGQAQRRKPPSESIT
jgi:nucleotidyltransferase-like protein